MTEEMLERLGEMLNEARTTRTTVAPIRLSRPKMTLDDAYTIQTHLRRHHVNDGARIVGHKVGATSEAIRTLFRISEPDFGFITDAMLLGSGSEIRQELLIQPMVEAEIAFRMRVDLASEAVTASDVLAASDAVIPVLEILDSRITGWDIGLIDTVADNASCGLVVLGNAYRLDHVDLCTAGVELVVDGARRRGHGADVMGNPATAVAWLANELGRRGETIKSGELVLAGAWAEALPMAGGSTARATFDGLGQVTCKLLGGSERK